MGKHKQFDINILGLSNDTHNYEWEVKNTFFEALDEPIVEKGNLKAIAELQKSERMIIVNLSISGIVELVCDRSLENFDYQLDVKSTTYFKYAEEYAEINEEVINIPFNLDKLNLAQLIYENIGINIPIKKLHPKFTLSELEEDDSEDVRLVYGDKDSAEESEEEKIDPRWSALKNLKN